MPGFYVGPGDMNTGSHAWPAGSLLTETSPQQLFSSFNFCPSSAEHEPVSKSLGKQQTASGPLVITKTPGLLLCKAGRRREWSLTFLQTSRTNTTNQQHGSFMSLDVVTVA